MAVSVSYPDGSKKSYSSADAAKADMASRGYSTYNDKVSGSGAGTSTRGASSAGGSSSGGGSTNTGSSGGGRSYPSSVEINGRTVTDPAQVQKITNNREAAARYAVNDYQQYGTPIPSNLMNTSYIQNYGTPQSAPSGGGGGIKMFGGYTGLRDMVNGGGPGTAGTTFQGGGAMSRAANALGVKPMGAGVGLTTGGTRIGAGGQLYLGGNDAWNQYTASLDEATRGARAARPAPTRGPNYIEGLGAPGTQDRGGDDGQSKSMSDTSAAPAPAAPVDGGIDSGNNLTGEQVSAANAERSKVPTYEAGGMVGPDGIPMRPSTVSLDLPPALARLLAMPTQSYAEGGMVGPGGVPQRPMTSPMAMQVGQQGGAPVVGITPPGAQGPGKPLNFAAIDQQAQQFMQQQPQQVAQIKAEVQSAMDSGELDPGSLNMFVQIATTALQNPEMWPQLRQVLIQQGMLDAEDVGEEYDQGFLIILYIIGKTMGSGGMPAAGQAPQGGMPVMEDDGMQGQMPMSQGQPPEMSMARGGALPSKSKNPDGSIPINAHEGEYVIPADVTRRLGTDHLDKLIAKARGMDSKGEQ